MARRAYVAALLLLFVAGAYAAESLDKKYNMMALCSGIAEVNRTTTTNRRCIALINVQFRTMSVKVYHNYVLGPSANNATAAHIHGPAYPGQTGPPIFTLDTTTNPMVITTDLTSSQEKDLLAGAFYINMHTANNAPGDIRGQIVSYNQMSINLATGFENPNPNGALTTAGATPADIVGYMLTNYDQTDRRLDYKLIHNVAGLTGAHFHGNANPGANPGPSAGNNAGVQQTLTGATPVNTVTEGSWTLSPIQEGYLNAGQIYVNLHNATAAGGVIRGNLNSQPHFLAELLPQHETTLTDATVTSGGAAVFQFYPDRNNRLEYWIVTNAPVTAMHIHSGAPGTDGAVVCTLQTSQTSTGSCNNGLTDAQVSDLLAGKLYVNVHTAANANGENRGQVLGLLPPNPGGFGDGSSTVTQIAVPVSVFTIVVLAAVAVCSQCKRNRAYCFKGAKNASGSSGPVGNGPAKQYSSPAASPAVAQTYAKPSRPVAQNTAAAAAVTKPAAGAVPVSLPDGWTQHENETGYTYYFHEESGASSWEPPPGSVF